jgi:hypothetical protein
MSVYAYSSRRAHFPRGLLVMALALLKRLQDKAPRLHLPTALADWSYERLLATARTCEDAFDAGHVAGYFDALSELSGIEKELLVYLMLRASNVKECGIAIRVLANAVAGMVTFK